MVCQQVVVERSLLSAPYTAIAVSTLIVHRHAQALRQYAPLQGKLLVAIERATLIHTPRQRAVVNDDVLTLLSVLVVRVHRVILKGRVAELLVTLPVALALVTHTTTYIPHYDVVSIDTHSIVLQADTIARRRLSQYRHVVLLYAERTLQLYRSRHVEHHDARTLLAQRISQRANILVRIILRLRLAVVRIVYVVIQSCNVNNFTPSAACGIASVALSTRKSRRRSKLRLYIHCRDQRQRRHGSHHEALASCHHLSHHFLY